MGDDGLPSCKGCDCSVGEDIPCSFRGAIATQRNATAIWGNAAPARSLPHTSRRAERVHRSPPLSFLPSPLSLLASPHQAPWDALGCPRGHGSHPAPSALISAPAASAITSFPLNPFQGINYTAGGGSARWGGLSQVRRRQDHIARGKTPLLQPREAQGDPPRGLKAAWVTVWGGSNFDLQDAGAIWGCNLQDLGVQGHYLGGAIPNRRQPQAGDATVVWRKL